MPMSVGESIDFYSEEAESSEEFFERARAEGQRSVLLNNGASAVECWLMAGLMTWRHDLGDPRSALASAFDIAVRLAPETRQGADTSSELAPLVKGAYLGRLLGRESDALQAALPPPSSIESNRDEAELILDLRLLQALDRQETGGVTNEGIEPPSRLLADTYTCYFQILAASEAELPAWVQRAEQLFGQRRRESYYSGGIESQGGGPDNDHVVDYVLAAVLKNRGVSELSEIHGWRWG